MSTPKEVYGTDEGSQAPAGCQHEWKEGYYGCQCTHCKLFYAFGTAPWEYPDDWHVCPFCHLKSCATWNTAGYCDLGKFTP
jgi:hypothetical protein